MGREAIIGTWLSHYIYEQWLHTDGTQIGQDVSHLHVVIFKLFYSRPDVMFYTQLCTLPSISRTFIDIYLNRHLMNHCIDYT